MAITRKRKRKVPMISTASLPDIVFMLLFFFLTVTTLRQSEELVRVKLPEASEVAKIDRKDLTCYIYVGTPVPTQQARYGTDARIQLNDSFREIAEIRDFIANERERRSESDRQFMSTTLKVDSDVRMGIITDIKQELRRCSALKLNYSARKGKQPH